MSEYYLHWPDHNADQLSWCSVNDAARGPVNQGSLKEAAEHIGRQKCVLLLSDRFCAVHTISLPPTSFAKAQLAAPFALEEQIASDIEDMHIAIGKPIDDLYPCIVIERSIMQRISNALRNVGLQPRIISVDTLCLPPPLCLVADDNGLFIRSPEIISYISNAMAKPLLESILPKDDSQPVLRYKIAAAAPPWSEASTQVDHLLAVLSIDHAPEGANLIRAEFNPNKDVSANLKPWIRPISLAAACLILMLVGKVISNQNLKQQLDALRAQQLAIYTEVFPETKGKVLADPARTLRAKVKLLDQNQSSKSTLIDLLAPISESISKSEITLKSLSLLKGKMELNITAPSFAALETIKSQLETASGRRASLQQVRELDGLSSALIRLEGAS